MRVRQVWAGGAVATMLLAGGSAAARPRAAPLLPPVDAGSLAMMDTDVTIDGRRGAATTLGVPRTSNRSVLARPLDIADGDEDADEDDLRDRAVPYLQVDVAALAGYDDNVDQDDDEDRVGSATYGVEGRVAAGVGSDRAKLALAGEGSLVQTPTVPDLDRYTAEAEVEGRVAIASALAATGSVGISRYALTDPAERMEYGSAGLELGDEAIGRVRAGVGIEQRRYRAAIADEADEGGPVRDTSDNDELRRLDYRRRGVDLAVERLGEGLFRPYALGSLYRIRFPNPSDEIGDRAAIDLAVELGAKLAFDDDFSFTFGGRYNRRDFRDPAQATVTRLSPTASLELSRGDWLDLTAQYRRELVQPELTNAIARDARVFELEAAVRPDRRWGLFFNTAYEFGREIRADAYDRELELTGRIEYLVLPKIRLLLEAYSDRYRYYQADVLDFGYDRLVLRGGVKTRF